MQRLLKPFSFIALASCFIFTPPYTAAQTQINEPFLPLQPSQEQVKTTLEIVQSLKQDHYRKQPLDDALSDQIFERYLDTLDSDRTYFTLADVSELETFRYQLDDTLNQGDLTPAFTIYNRYRERVITRIDEILDNLDALLNQMQFDRNERLQLERKKADWPQNDRELDEVWRKRLKNDALRLKLSGKTMAEIRSLLIKRYEKRLHRLEQASSEDAFQAYINAYARSYDPHSRYYSPRRAKNFSIKTRLSLEGIGAIMKLENGYPTVTRLLPGGPAAKDGNLKPGDRLVAIGQGDQGDLVNVIGWRLDKLMDLMLGPKGTTIRLQVLPADATDTHKTRLTTLTRDTVKLNKGAAQKQVITYQRNGKLHKIGVITLPSFYVDFAAKKRGEPDYRSTTRDVRRLVTELKQESVDGLIIDLRNNKGGALTEAISLMGLFIQRGPAVQLRKANGKVGVYGDGDPAIAYGGPLGVLVNRLSASASEVFAGAIQDYQRGLVIGDQTFGKGTIQTLRPLPHGQLKITHGKFYRISGKSTQHQGIVPDIRFPGRYDHTRIGESTLENALAWDSLKPVRHHDYGEIQTLLPQLRQQHQERVANDPDFTYFNKRRQWLREKKRKADSVSLHAAIRQQEREQLEQWQLTLENKRRKAKGLPLLNSVKELEQYYEQLNESSRPDKDPNLMETGEILLDFVQLNRLQLAQQDTSAP